MKFHSIDIFLIFIEQIKQLDAQYIKSIGQESKYKQLNNNRLKKKLIFRNVF